MAVCPKALSPRGEGFNSPRSQRIESAGSLELKIAGVDGAAAIGVRSAPELLGHTDKPILHAIRYLQHPCSVQVAFERHPEKELDTAGGAGPTLKAEQPGPFASQRELTRAALPR
ncbi:MAG: hypothetical protein HY901_11130 [Deltaproteobacteria bacterium]|nr:hypothetical protein [Deltaproteobacteria bacterium]